MSDFIELGPLQLGIATVLIVAAGVVSMALRLGIERRLGIAALRTVVQLGLLGLILEQIFALENPLLVVGLLILMTVFAAREAVTRASRAYRGILADAWLTMAATCFVVGGMVTGKVIERGVGWVIVIRGATVGSVEAALARVRATSESGDE